MSDFSSTTTDTAQTSGNNHGFAPEARREGQRPSRLTTETKSAFKTTELAVYILAVLGVLIASAVVDKSDFGAQEAWQFVTFLTVGYLLSRGLAKSGSRDPYDADDAR